MEKLADQDPLPKAALVILLTKLDKAARLPPSFHYGPTFTGEADMLCYRQKRWIEYMVTRGSKAIPGSPEALVIEELHKLVESRLRRMSPTLLTAEHCTD